MPGNTKPHKARQAKRKHVRLRKIGNLEDARRELWRAILCAKAVLLTPDNEPNVTLKAVNSVTKATSAYAKLVEARELEARLEALEKAFTIQANRGGDGQAGHPPKIRR